MARPVRMALAWAIFVPLGILVARYFKVTRRQDWPQRVDNRFWWHAHRTLQLAAFAISIAALWSVRHVAGSQASVARAHALAGWCARFSPCFRCCLASCAAPRVARRGTKCSRRLAWAYHYDMTPRRVAFEYLHKFGGLVCNGARPRRTRVGARRSRCTALDARRCLRLVVVARGLRIRVAATGSLSRHLPGHLGTGSSPSRQSTTADRSRCAAGAGRSVILTHLRQGISARRVEQSRANHRPQADGTRCAAARHRRGAAGVQSIERRVRRAADDEGAGFLERAVRLLARASFSCRT